MKKKYTSEEWGEVTLDFSKKYSNGQRAVLVTSAEHGPLGKLTVCIPNDQLLMAGWFLEDNEYIIKEYSENAEVVEEIAKQGWFDLTTRRINTNFTSAAVWELKPELMIELKGGE